MTRTPPETWASYLAVWNGAAPLSDLEELLDPEYGGQVGGLQQDSAALATRIEVYRLAHPEARFEILEQFACDDRLVTRLQVHGLTGQQQPMHGMNIGQHRDGRLLREWAVWESV